MRVERIWPSVVGPKSKNDFLKVSEYREFDEKLLIQYLLYSQSFATAPTFSRRSKFIKCTLEILLELVKNENIVILILAAGTVYGVVW